MNRNGIYTAGLDFAPRRVLMTADTLGGVWTYAMELTRVLGEQGIEVALATMGAPLDGEQWREAECIPNLEVFESSYRLEWMPDPWEDVEAAGEWLLGLEQRFRPDLIHLNNYAHAALPFSAPRVVVAHSCVLSWWDAVRGDLLPLCWQRYRRTVTAGLRAADVVVAPSRAMLREAQRHYGPFKQAEIIPNGRTVVFDRVRKENFVFSAGRLWDEAKNIAALAWAAPHLRAPVYVAGEAKAPGGQKIFFRNVNLLGRLSQTQMAHWLERAAIFCLPARYEPFGLAVLEAALAGCALVLGDIPSLREIWGDAAVFVPPENPAALRTRLNALLSDGAQVRHLAARARERALEFTPSNMAAAYLAVYSELVPEPALRDPVLACE